MSPRRPTALTRRTLLLGLGVAPLAGCMVTGNPPLPHARIRAVRIDVSPLVDKGVSNWAARIEKIADAAARVAFADVLAPQDTNAPTLTLVIGEAHLDSYSGGAAMLGDVDTAKDWIDGRIRTSAVRGLPALDRRVYADCAAADSGPWYVPGIDDRRIETLTRVWVASTRRELAD